MYVFYGVRPYISKYRWYMMVVGGRFERIVQIPAYRFRAIEYFEECLLVQFDVFVVFPPVFRRGCPLRGPHWAKSMQ